MDQIFVLLKHWLVSYAPAAVQPVFAALLSVAAIIVVFASLFAVTTILERKGLGRFQNRYGPNRVGPYGLLQPLADGLKSLTKEDIVPACGGQDGAFSGAAGTGGRRRFWAMRCCRSDAIWWPRIWMRGAVLLCRGIDG